MQINPRLDPDTTHPIVLFEDLYGEDPRAPQTQFVLERQIAFLEALAVTGSVRAAARRVKVSHQTCYRARRGSAAFGRAWDAALVIARASAEAQLGEWAMHGRVVDVWYHGEIVGQRTVHSDRLMLAHLARLDRKCDDERVAAMAEDFDGLIRRMREAGEVVEERDDQGDTPDSSTGEISSPGHRSMRSMSECLCPTLSVHEDEMRPTAQLHEDGEEGVPDGGGESDNPPSSSDGPQVAEGDRPTDHAVGQTNMPHQPCPTCGGKCADPAATLTRADCQWFGNRLERMLEARPAYAPDPREVDQEAWDSGLLDDIHIAGFEQGIRKWWMLKSKDAEKVGLKAG